MLRNNEPDGYAAPELVRGKLEECRRKAGNATPARARPASPAADRLNEVYRAHGLPTGQAPPAWSAGERRGFADPDVAGFAEEVHGPRRKAAKPRKAKAKVKA